MRSKKEKKQQHTDGWKKFGDDEETAKNDNDETRRHRKREAQKRGRHGRETGPR